MFGISVDVFEKGAKINTQEEHKMADLGGCAV
jgi:hypothetical protein